MLLRIRETAFKFFRAELIRSAAIYTITGAINSGIPFLLLPFLTRYLTTAEYGIVAMFSSVALILLPFVNINGQAAIGRQFVERDELDFPEYVRNVLYILISATMLVAVGMFILRGILTEATQLPWPWIMFIPFLLMGRSLVFILLVLFQMRKQPLQFGIFRMVVSSLDIGLSLLLVIGFGFTWIGRIGSQVIAESLAGIFVVYVLLSRKWISGKPNWEYLKHALRFGVPLIPYTFGVNLILLVDKFFITWLIGVEETGIYDVGYKFGMVLSLLQNAFNQAYVPWLFEKLKADEESDQIRIVRYTYIYFVAIVVIAIGFSLIAPFLISFYVSEAFFEASQFVIWIALGYAFSGMYKMVSNYIFYSERTYLLSYVVIFTAIVNIVLNYVFIRQFGSIGAAQATLIAFVLNFVITFWLSNRVHPMPWFEFRAIVGMR